MNLKDRLEEHSIFARVAKVAAEEGLDLACYKNKQIIYLDYHPEKSFAIPLKAKSNEYSISTSTYTQVATKKDSDGCPFFYFVVRINLSTS